MSEEAMVELTTECVCCRAKKTYTLPAARVKAWNEGMLIQDAFPELSADDREFLISGVCPECWNKIFNEEDNDGI